MNPESYGPPKSNGPLESSGPSKIQYRIVFDVTFQVVLCLCNNHPTNKLPLFRSNILSDCNAKNMSLLSHSVNHAILLLCFNFQTLEVINDTRFVFDRHFEYYEISGCTLCHPFSQTRRRFLFFSMLRIYHSAI